MQLYTFFQSGSAYRIRIALALKGLDYEPVYVVGGRGANDLQKPDYVKLNPSAVVPTLVDGGIALNQTIAIMEYLDDKYPASPLLPAGAVGRARARAMALVMVADTHPLITARVIEYLDATLETPKDALDGWLRHWNQRGYGVIEKMLAGDGVGGAYCHGDRPTMADICLVAQVFAGKKFGVDISAFANVNRVYEHCLRHPAFADTAPEKQPDAKPA